MTNGMLVACCYFTPPLTNYQHIDSCCDTTVEISLTTTLYCADVDIVCILVPIYSDVLELL